MEIKKCYTCDNPRLIKDRDTYTKQTDTPKLNLLLFKYKSGMWNLTRKELATLKQNFNFI